MSRVGGAVRVVLRAAAIGGVVYALRARLVAVLTKTTGTWVGSPDDRPARR